MSCLSQDIKTLQIPSFQRELLLLGNVEGSSAISANMEQSNLPREINTYPHRKRNSRPYENYELKFTKSA